MRIKCNWPRWRKDAVCEYFDENADDDFIKCSWSWPDVCSCWRAHHYWEPHTPPLTLGELRNTQKHTGQLSGSSTFQFPHWDFISGLGSTLTCEGLKYLGNVYVFYSVFYNGRERFQSDTEIINIELYPPYLSLLSGHHLHKTTLNSRYYRSSRKLVVISVYSAIK